MVMVAPECDVIVDEEFRRLVPPLTEEERLGLEDNLLRDGCLDPLVVWAERRVLLDGHNRKEICGRYGIDYTVRELSLPDRDAAADWIDAHQLGRRNLTPAQTSLMRVRRYNRAKGKREDNLKQGAPKDQNDTSVETASRLARGHGVSPPTIKRDGKPTLSANSPKGSIDTRGKVARLAGVGSGPSGHQKSDNPRNTNEEPAPEPEILVAAEARDKQSKRSDLGKDFPQESGESQHQRETASRFATLAGMSHDTIAQAVVLVNNATETRWFQALLGVASAVCFHRRPRPLMAPREDLCPAPGAGGAVLRWQRGRIRQRVPAAGEGLPCRQIKARTRCGGIAGPRGASTSRNGPRSSGSPTVCPAESH